MDTAEREITAEEAIEAGFRYFRNLVASTSYANAEHVLLEGLSYNEQTRNWEVTIGFDVGRAKETSSPLSFAQSVKEPIRELRTFHIDAKDGALVRMN